MSGGTKVSDTVFIWITVTGNTECSFALGNIMPTTYYGAGEKRLVKVRSGITYEEFAFYQQDSASPDCGTILQELVKTDDGGVTYYADNRP